MASGPDEYKEQSWENGQKNTKVLGIVLIALVGVVDGVQWVRQKHVRKILEILGFWLIRQTKNISWANRENPWMFTISQATELSLSRLGDPKRTGWRRGG